MSASLAASIVGPAAAEAAAATAAGPSDSSRGKRRRAGHAAVKTASAHAAERITERDSVELRDDRAQNLSASVFQLIDVIIDRPRRNLRRDIEFREPGFHIGEDAGIGSYGQNRVYAVEGNELNRASALPVESE